MTKRVNPLSLTKSFPFSKTSVRLKGCYTAYLLGLFVAFEQFGKLAPVPQVMGRDLEKRTHCLNQSFTPNKILQLKPEDNSKSYIYFSVLDHYTHLGIPKL